MSLPTLDELMTTIEEYKTGDVGRRYLRNDLEAFLYIASSAQQDAERWRAVAPTLVVRNHALSASFEEPSPMSLESRKTWLESRNPIDGTYYTVADYVARLVDDAARKAVSPETR